ncbi:hypothetical protein Sjap_015166 [Stephania japonica]|uniref:Uncharacterized protein n=1 Tax=Stephania japonica TaxID=461633 RepID=A0AAP0IIL6_9MAGN
MSWPEQVASEHAPEDRNEPDETTKVVQLEDLAAPDVIEELSIEEDEAIPLASLKRKLKGKMPMEPKKKVKKVSGVPRRSSGLGITEGRFPIMSSPDDEDSDPEEVPRMKTRGISKYLYDVEAKSRFEDVKMMKIHAERYLHQDSYEKKTVVNFLKSRAYESSESPS